jgi:hypothetical protein
MALATVDRGLLTGQVLLYRVWTRISAVPLIDAGAKRRS